MAAKTPVIDLSTHNGTVKVAMIFNTENLPSLNVGVFVSSEDLATIREILKDQPDIYIGIQSQPQAEGDRPINARVRVKINEV